MGSGGAGDGGGGAGGVNGTGDEGGGRNGGAGRDDGAGTDVGADVGTNVDGDGGGGNDVPSGTDAAIDDLFGVNRIWHPLSPTASKERPVVRHKRRPKWISRRVDSDEESARRSSENSSDQVFIVTDGASLESR